MSGSGEYDVELLKSCSVRVQTCQHFGNSTVGWKNVGAIVCKHRAQIAKAGNTTLKCRKIFSRALEILNYASPSYGSQEQNGRSCEVTNCTQPVSSSSLTQCNPTTPCYAHHYRPSKRRQDLGTQSFCPVVRSYLTSSLTHQECAANLRHISIVCCSSDVDNALETDTEKCPSPKSNGSLGLGKIDVQSYAKCTCYKKKRANK